MSSGKIIMMTSQVIQLYWNKTGEKKGCGFVMFEVRVTGGECGT